MDPPCFTALVPPQSLMDSKFHLTHHRCPWCCSGRFKREVFPSVLSEGTKGRGVPAMWVCPCWCQVTVGKSCSVHFSGEEDEIKEDAHQKAVIGVRFSAVPCTVQHLGCRMLGPKPCVFWAQWRFGQRFQCALMPSEQEWPVALAESGCHILPTAHRGCRAVPLSGCLLCPHGRHSAVNRKRATACGAAWH